MSCELVACVLVLVQLLVVDLPDLGELRAVVRVLDSVICIHHIAITYDSYAVTVAYTIYTCHIGAYTYQALSGKTLYATLHFLQRYFYGGYNKNIYKI